MTSKIVRVIKECNSIKKGAYKCVGEILNSRNEMVLLIEHPDGMPFYQTGLILPEGVKCDEGTKLFFLSKNRVMS